MRLAIAHDWLLNLRGAERVLRDFCAGLEPTQLYTLLLDHRALAPELQRQTIYRSRLGRWPGVNRFYRGLFPLLPRAIESMLVRECDTLVSVSHSVAKAIPREKGIRHFCCCLTPMRYLWEPHLYASMEGSPEGWIYRAALKIWGDGLKDWDRETAANVDQFVAISQTVRDRIKSAYGRDSIVIYPGIDLEYFRPIDRPREDFYLIVSALVPQKQLEVAIAAFDGGGRRLVVAGSGPWRARLERRGSSNVHFLGWQTDEQVRDLYSRARALIFPGVEDFGLVPVEAQAMGCPVIAFAQGGVTETVIEGESGLFFAERSGAALARTMRQLENEPLDPDKVMASGRRFSRDQSLRKWRRLLGLPARESSD